MASLAYSDCVQAARSITSLASIPANLPQLWKVFPSQVALIANHQSLNHEKLCLDQPTKHLQFHVLPNQLFTDFARCQHVHFEADDAE
jgi:hypothetical protein